MKSKGHLDQYTVVVEQDEDGLYVATCPALQGCYTQGRSYKEAMENIRDAVRLHLGARIKMKEYIEVLADYEIALYRMKNKSDKILTSKEFHAKYLRGK